MTDARSPYELALAATASTNAPPVALIDLVSDLDRYVAIEPRLCSARWLVGDTPAVGAQVVLETEIPFTVPIIRQLLHRSTTTVTITHWSPPNVARMDFDGGTFAGSVCVELTAMCDGSMVTVRGLLWPKSRALRLALRPIRHPLERLARRAIIRGIRRAARPVEL